MKRKSILALLLALLLLAVGCSRVDESTVEDEPSAPAALSVGARGALLDVLAPEGCTLSDLRGDGASAYDAADAIRAADYLAALRGFAWHEFVPPEETEDGARYALVADGAALTLYSFNNAAALYAEAADGAGWFTVQTLTDTQSGETVQTNWQLYDTVRAWYLEAEAAALHASGGVPLTAEELSTFEQFTENDYTEDGVTYVRPVACFFTSTYRDVRDLDAREFIAYCPGEGYVTNADGEEAWLVAEKFDWRGDDGQLFTVDELPVPCHRLSRAYLDGILTEYAGVTVAEMHSDWTAELFYLPETDCFYTFTSDYGPGVFSPAYGERNGDTVTLWESSWYGGDCLTLKADGDGWHILSHIPTDEVFCGRERYGVAYLGWGEAGDLSAYAERFEFAEDIPTYRVSDGDYYLIVPRYEGMQMRLYRNDSESGERTLLYEEEACRPFLLACNVSDIFPDATVALTWEEETVEFSPFISLRDGTLEVGARGLDITQA